MHADNGYIARGYTLTLRLQSDPSAGPGLQILSFQIDRPNVNGMTVYSESITYEDNRPVHYEERMVNPNEVDARLSYDIEYVTVGGEARVRSVHFQSRQEFIGSMAGQETLISSSRQEYTYDAAGRILRTLGVERFEQGEVEVWFALATDQTGYGSGGSTVSYWITETAQDFSYLRMADWDLVAAAADVREEHHYGDQLNANGAPLMEHSIYSKKDAAGVWKPALVFEPAAYMRAGGGTQHTVVVGEPDVTSGETDDIWITGFENFPPGYSFGLGMAEDWYGRLIGVTRVRGFGLYAIGPGGSATRPIDFPNEDFIVLDGKNYRLRLDASTGKIVFTEEAWEPFTVTFSASATSNVDQNYTVNALADGTVQMGVWGNVTLTAKVDPRTLTATFPAHYGNVYQLEFEHLGGASYQVKRMTMRSQQHDFRWEFEQGKLVSLRQTQLGPRDWNAPVLEWIRWFTSEYDLTYTDTGTGRQVASIVYRMVVHRSDGDYMDNTNTTYFGYAPDGALVTKLHHRTNADVYGDPYYHFATLQEMNSDGSVSVYYGDTRVDYSSMIGSAADAWVIKRDSRVMDLMYPMSMKEDFATQGSGWVFGVPDYWIQYVRGESGEFEPRTAWERTNADDGTSVWTYKLVTGEPDVLGGGESDDRIFNPWKVVGLPDHLAGVVYGPLKDAKPHASWDIFWDMVGYGLGFYEGAGSHYTGLEAWIDFPKETRVTLDGTVYDVTLNEEGALVFTEAPLPPPAILPPQSVVRLPAADSGMDGNGGSSFTVGPDGRVTLVHDGLVLEGIAELLGPSVEGCSGPVCAQDYRVVFRDPWPRVTGEDRSNLTVRFTGVFDAEAEHKILVEAIDSRRTVASTVAERLVSDFVETVTYEDNLPAVRTGYRINESGVRTDWRNTYTYHRIGGRPVLTESRTSLTSVTPGGGSAPAVTVRESGSQLRIHDPAGRPTALIESGVSDRDGIPVGWAQAQILDPQGDVADHYRTLSTADDILAGLGAEAALQAVIASARALDHYARDPEDPENVTVVTSLRRGPNFVPWIRTSAQGDQYFVVGEPDVPGGAVDDVRFAGVEGLPEDSGLWWGLGIGMERAAGLYFVEQSSFAETGRPKLAASMLFPEEDEVVLNGVRYAAALFSDGVIRLSPVDPPAAPVPGQVPPTRPAFSSSSGVSGAALSGNEPWWLGAVRAPDAWGISTGRGITVAVIDTGVDLTHEDLAGNIWTNAGEIAGNGIDDDGNGYIDDVHGWDFVNGDNDATDDQGHGTHVAGIIGALAGNGLGIAGIAPEANIMAVKVLSRHGSGTFDQIVAGIRYAADMGAQVINLSLGAALTYTLDYIRQNFVDAYEKYLKQMVDAVLYALSKGSVVVAAAGNSAMNVNRFIPSGIAGAISVGATTAAGDRAFFSNFGMTMDLAAPGYDILSLRAAGTTLGRPLNSGYTSASGTSMAAPMVSGAIALLLAQDPTLSIDGINSRIKRSSADLGAAEFDTWFGSGLIDTYAMLSRDYYSDGTLRSVRHPSPDAFGYVAYDYDPDGRTIRKVGGDGATYLYEYWGDSMSVRAVRVVVGGRLAAETVFGLDGKVQHSRTARDPGMTLLEQGLGQPIDLWLAAAPAPFAEGYVTLDPFSDTRFLSGFRFTEFNDYEDLFSTDPDPVKRRSFLRSKRPVRR